MAMEPRTGAVVYLLENTSGIARLGKRLPDGAIPVLVVACVVDPYQKRGVGYSSLLLVYPTTENEKRIGIWRKKAYEFIKEKYSISLEGIM